MEGLCEELEEGRDGIDRIPMYIQKDQTMKIILYSGSVTMRYIFN